MRYGPDYYFYVVTDPRQESEIEDILSRASLRELELRFRGGLTIDEHPTLFTDEKEAKIEAYGRIVALKAAGAIKKNMDGGIDRIEILDGEGTVLFEADIPQGIAEMKGTEI